MARLQNKVSDTGIAEVHPFAENRGGSVWGRGYSAKADNRRLAERARKGWRKAASTMGG